MPYFEENEQKWHMWTTKNNSYRNVFPSQNVFILILLHIREPKSNQR